MFEVEKKFLLTPNQEKRIRKGSKYQGEKIFTDTYFDNGEYELTLNDIWLRLRDKNAELKMPLEKQEERSEIFCNRYEEFNEEAEIRQMLNMRGSGEFLEDLKTHGYHPFATITTRRETYRKQDFRIDIDAVDFGYALVEIELLVEREEDIKAAEAEIGKFAALHQLKIDSVRGKVVEYLFRNSPDHFRMLLEAGIIVP